ncbi:hypothetical protein [Kitasatospora sp. A2-31]|uniref:hypothetical protein n=1 Tax=Kitasatospora sp. A2-31 TaxID=2916414 RepID=UPI001EE9E733|nr:hypothetical protein [Kitasatospora sp. A2-31]MCG6494432.1 hypothetical protein [Kitasatospora sp. A2-31]MCG6500071.1 hypothetical protein [Kitasatospora sp. A2-31]
MNAPCPQCAASDECATVSQSLVDIDRPLDEVTRALLSSPPEPAGMSGASIALLCLAGLFALGGVRGLLADDDGSGSDTAYQAGRTLGPFLFAAILAGVGLAVNAVAQRRRRAAQQGQGAAPTRVQWEQHRRVWRAAWLCRRCRVTFFPAASIRPDFPASPAIPVEQFPLRVATTAERAFGTTAPPLPH